jgi:protein involved in polysaccharide export with SLBB domain
MRLPALLIVLAAFVGPSALIAQNPAPAAPAAGTTLEPGDTIRIIVWRKPEFSGDFVIGQDGTITHPLYRAIKVGGVPIPQAEDNIRRFLLQYDQNPQFVMEPLISVSVSGEVPRPSVFAVQPKTSIAEAVARAGGPTNAGNQQRVRIFRADPGGNRRELLVNLKDPEDPIGRAPVHSGDQIIVDKTHSFFREILLPTLSLLGSLASIALLIRRFNK